MTNLDMGHATTYSVLDDLHMSQRPWDTKAYLGWATAVTGTAWSVSTQRVPAENLRKERGIASFTVGQQHQILSLGQTGRSILE